MQGAEQPCQLGKLIVCIESARVGQYPDFSALKAPILFADGGFPDAEAVAIGADAEERDDFRSVSPDFCTESLAAGDELGGRHLVSGRARAVDEVRDAVAIL